MQNIEQKKDIWDNLDLDYVGENNFASFYPSSSNIHNYPARLVPEMVHSLLKTVASKYKINRVLDPFVGSGTTGLETKYLGLEFYGSDLNPLSILLARTKTITSNNIKNIQTMLSDFANQLPSTFSLNSNMSCVYFKNIIYWFKPDNIEQISFLKYEIDRYISTSSNMYREPIALILLTALSSTIRESSLTRNNEFKLYRLSPTDINKFDKNSFTIFKNKLESLLEVLVFANEEYDKNADSNIFLANAKDLFYLKDKYIDLILTSPPYGDSQSTVAYGQFSRLSLQWIKDLLYKYLGIEVAAENSDPLLLGGKRSKIKSEEREVFQSSQTLTSLKNKMDSIITEEKNYWLEALIELNYIESLIKSNSIQGIINIKNKKLLEIISERIRLYSLRKINLKAEFTNNQSKKVAKIAMARFLDGLSSLNKRKRYRCLAVLQTQLPFIRNTINRKLKYQPKRVSEVIGFFRDLYDVVLETNRVLNEDGIQIWVVGNRTVLGTINVNLKEILLEWFSYLGYEEVKSLQRKYSFKRMPQHINSTATRNHQVTTMQDEYILIVQKRNAKT